MRLGAKQSLCIRLRGAALLRWSDNRSTCNTQGGTNIDERLIAAGLIGAAGLMAAGFTAVWRSRHHLEGSDVIRAIRDGSKGRRQQSLAIYAEEVAAGRAEDATAG